MPAYLATVLGENFDFVVDDEPQLLDFSRTIYIEADDIAAAKALALQKVREELQSQSLLDDNSGQSISVDGIDQIDFATDSGQQGEFIWTFQVDDEFDDED